MSEVKKEPVNIAEGKIVPMVKENFSAPLPPVTPVIAVKKEDDVLGRMIVTIFKNKESEITYSGVIDPMAIQGIVAKIRLGYYTDYMQKRREVELSELDVKKAQIEADQKKKALELAVKTKFMAELKVKEAKEKKEAEEKAAEELLKNNQKAEAERVLKIEAERKKKVEGDQVAVEAAKALLEIAKVEGQSKK